MTSLNIESKSKVHSQVQWSWLSTSFSLDRSYRDFWNLNSTTELSHLKAREPAIHLQESVSYWLWDNGQGLPPAKSNPPEKSLAIHRHQPTLYSSWEGSASSHYRWLWGDPGGTAKLSNTVFSNEAVSNSLLCDSCTPMCFIHIMSLLCQLIRYTNDIWDCFKLKAVLLLRSLISVS